MHLFEIKIVNIDPLHSALKHTQTKKICNTLKNTYNDDVNDNVTFANTDYK